MNFETFTEAYNKAAKYTEQVAQHVKAVKVDVVSASQIVRQVTLPNAFVMEYSEELDDETGVGQFYLGRKIGGKYGDKISGAQGLGQKNTVLAIWMALTYLSPITSIGPASYIIWQNSINSYQLYLKEKRAAAHR